MSIDRHRPGQDWTMAAHSHLAYDELIVITRGRQGVAMGSARFSAGAGDVLLYPAGAVHEEWAEGDEPLESLFMSFHWTKANEDAPLHLHDRKGRIRELASWLFAEREAYFADCKAYLDSLTRALLAEYLRLSEHEEHETVGQIRAYVRRNLDRPLSLDALAARIGMSKFHFLRTYQQLSGFTPMEDVRRIRVEAARQLLLTTNLPLKTIAARVGIANEYHLSRLLKSRLGAGARELRRAAAKRN